MKKCIKCKVLQDINCFRTAKDCKDGYRGCCKLCETNNSKEYYKNNRLRLIQYSKKYRENNKEKITISAKLWKDENKEKIKEYEKKYNLTNKEKKSAYYLNNKEKNSKNRKEYYLKNKDKIKEKNKEWLANNKEKRKEYMRNYIPTDNAKLARVISKGIMQTIKRYGAKKSDSTMKLVGCSTKFFHDYIESKFTKGMTWENRGNNGWHFDHIRPCSSFDLSDPEQQKLCFHYSNYQPLWATTAIAMKYGESPEYIGNMEKGDRVYKND